MLVHFLGKTRLINGLVASESRRLGLPSPVCDVLTEINERITAGELKADGSNLELAVRMLKERGAPAIAPISA